MADEMYTPEKPGAWRRIAAFLKRFWAVSLVALVPLIPEFVEVWGMSNPFPAVPDIITEAEIREISADTKIVTRKMVITQRAVLFLCFFAVLGSDLDTGISPLVC